MQKPSLPKGTRDFGPITSARRKHIFDVITTRFEKYSFMKIETPAMEQLSVLMGKYGEEGDQLLFKILNSGDYLKKTTGQDYEKGAEHMLEKVSEKGLRYDLTVPFARFVVMNQHNITFPFKRYQIQPVWRADRPQRGRYREFYQCDADIIGSNSIWNEVELTLLAREVFEGLGLSDFKIKVNHRDVLFALAAKVDMGGDETRFCSILDKIDKIGQDAVMTELVNVGASADQLEAIVPMLTDTLGFNIQLEKIEKIIGRENAGWSSLKTYQDQLGHLGNSGEHVVLDLTLARGLSYYTGMIFEVVPTTVKMGSICGGGRYDNLTGVFGLQDVSGVGISFGLDRIYDVLDELNLFPDTIDSFTQVLVTHIDDPAFNYGLTILQALRGAGISADIYPEKVRLKKQFNYANKLNVPYVVTIGEEEVQSKQVRLKDMTTGKQLTCNPDELIHLVKKGD